MVYNKLDCFVSALSSLKLEIYILIDIMKLLFHSLQFLENILIRLSLTTCHVDENKGFDQNPTETQISKVIFDKKFERCILL